MAENKTSILLSDVSVEGDLVEKDKVIVDAKISGDIKADEIDTHSNSNIKGNFIYLKEILDNRDDYIGKYATIKYFELTPDGVPRFPYAIAFRDYE